MNIGFYSAGLYYLHLDEAQLSNEYALVVSTCLIIWSYRILVDQLNSSIWNARTETCLQIKRIVLFSLNESSTNSHSIILKWRYINDFIC